MPEPTQKIKVAVLGGGVGSMVTAFELTSTPALCEKYEITVYQMGWRLGGKGTSGRNMQHHGRIEEHGLHLWFGFYENAFNCIRRCYQELGRAPGTPLATWQDAFKPQSIFVINERYKGQWVNWEFEVPPNSSMPGDGAGLPTFWEIAAEILSSIWAIFHLVTYEKQPYPQDGWKAPEWWEPLVKHLKADLSDAGEYEELKLLALAYDLAQFYRPSANKQAPQEHRTMFCEMLTKFKKWLWDAWVKPYEDHKEFREFFVALDLATTALCGILADGILENGFASVDDTDFIGWLRKHGASNCPTLDFSRNPFLKGMYDVAFAYEDGDVQRPNFAAGAALSGALRLFMTYKGPICWKMQAGMGDTIFSPFYEVLRRRGVKFRFFHFVDQLIVSPDRKEISAIEVIPQVRLTADEYDPLILVRDLPCWPSDPLWDQLQNGQQLRQAGVNFEEDINPLGVKPITLRKGEDFDLIVLGISLGALPHICRDLIKQHESWQNLMKYVKTVRTQAIQLWINKNPKDELGWAHHPKAMIGTYIEPLDTICNMEQLLEMEDWPPNYNLSTITYLCGVLDEKIPDETLKDAMERVKAHGITFVNNHVGNIWPNALRNEGTQKAEFDWNILIDPENRTGESRFDAQFWRANFVPSERYVQSLAGSTKYRLRADGSGYANLYLTGDWLLNGFNVGNVESATASGMQASRAICGIPKCIYGEVDPWL